VLWLGEPDFFNTLTILLREKLLILRKISLFQLDTLCSTEYDGMMNMDIKKVRAPKEAVTS
jgi:hypothetical protein